MPSTLIHLRYAAIQVLARHMLGGGRVDLVVNSGSGLYVIENLGHRRWRKMKVQSESDWVVTAGDVTGDGKRDLLTYRPFGAPHLQIFAWQPGGSYALAGGYNPVSPPRSGWTLAVGDVTGDQRNDVVLTINDNVPRAGIDIFAGKRNGTLAAPFVIKTEDGTEVQSLRDLNGDGRRDIVLLHAGFAEAGVLMQQKDGSIGSESLFPIPHVSQYPLGSLSVRDVNSDGKPDVVIGSESSVVLRQL